MQRERITITVDADLLAAVDELIDHSKIRNRSHAIEHAIRTGITLTDITQAFFILGNTFPDSPIFDPLMREMQKMGFQKIYLVSEPGKYSEAEQFAGTIRQSLVGSSVEVLPGDFGTGGALLLRQRELTGPFLIVDFSECRLVPDRLSVAYSFHHERHMVLTHILTSDDGINFSSSGVSFAEPELCSYVPAGIANLAQDVFPALVKECKVSTYVCQNRPT